MPHDPLLLGFDLSTTGAKALLCDSAGRVVASATSPLTLSTPHPLWAEQDPAAWWAATCASIRDVLATAAVTGTRVIAIGPTGQMHGLVLLDAQDAVLRPAILWNDQRTAAECDAIRARVGHQRLLAITGNDALPGFTAPKLMWVRDHEPAVYARARHVLLPKDYIRLCLTGEYATDKADASGTLLFDLRARDWSAAVLAALDIPAPWLPPAFEGPQITGYVSAAAAAATGLAAGTPVVAGGGDQAAQAVGVGAVRPGIMAVTLGTSGVAFTSTDAPRIEPQGRLHAFCHALPDRWHLMGVMLSAAGSLRWYREAFAPDVSYDALLASAAEAPPGSDGLLFLPYLTGERTPYSDPLARGAWVGLTLRHRRAHLIRALLEGVAFGLRDTVALLRAADAGAMEQVRISGGGARSTLWRQILADVLGVPLLATATVEGAGYGAAVLAGVGVGIWPDVPSACARMPIAHTTTPAAGRMERYDALYQQYRALYPALRPTFMGLAQVG